MEIDGDAGALRVAKLTVAFLISLVLRHKLLTAKWDSDEYKLFNYSHT